VATKHYFSDAEGEELDLREIEVKLAGEKFSVYTSSGIFSPEHLDQGTDVLLKQLDKVTPHGTVLDLGCGWGPIAIVIAKTNPKTKVIAVDVNHKSLALTRLNAEKLGIKNIEVFLPEEVPIDLVFDEIWSNPPIRVGKQALHGMLHQWLPRLRKGGVSRLVVQKNLGSDSLHKWLMENLKDFETSRVDSIKGFRILKSIRN
jgi:16S rRNA (guanine1207-N2)-methyltransferase